MRQAAGENSRRVKRSCRVFRRLNQLKRKNSRGKIFETCPFSLVPRIRACSYARTNRDADTMVRLRNCWTCWTLNNYFFLPLSLLHYFSSSLFLCLPFEKIRTTIGTLFENVVTIVYIESVTIRVSLRSPLTTF